MIENILQSDAVQIFVYGAVQSLPHVKGWAMFVALALAGLIIHASNGRKAALCNPQNITHRIFIGGLGQPVSALKPATGLENIGFVKNGNYLLQVFF